MVTSELVDKLASFLLFISQKWHVRHCFAKVRKFVPLNTVFCHVFVLIDERFITCNRF